MLLIHAKKFMYVQCKKSYAYKYEIKNINFITSLTINAIIFDYFTW